LKELEAKIRSTKGVVSTAQPSKEENPNTLMTSERKFVKSRSFEGERDPVEDSPQSFPVEDSPQSEVEKGSNAATATKSKVSEATKVGISHETEGTGKTPSSTSDTVQLSPSRDPPSKTSTLQKPPILPYQKKTGSRNNGNNISQVNTQRKNPEARNQLATGTPNSQNVVGETPIVSNQSSPTTSVQLVNDGYNMHEHHLAPRPPSANSNSRTEQIPSATNYFDPLSQTATNDNGSVEAFFESSGPSIDPLPSPLPGFIVTPVNGQNPDILSFPLDSWIHATNYASDYNSEMQDQRQAMYLIHQPLEMQSVDSSHLFGDSNHIPLMTYSVQPNGHNQQPSISDFNSSKDHSRNPSAGQIPHINQSWTSSPSHQGTYTPTQTDILSSDNLTIPLTDYMSSEYEQSERELLLPTRFTPVQGEDMAAWSDPFDPIVQRKANADDF
jgi:hypothetical protein